MRAYRCFKASLASMVISVLALNFFGATPAYGGGQLAVTFTTTMPAGSPGYPDHVQAVWVEDATGVLVKTIGRWGFIKYYHLSQWMAADGTAIDGITGATQMVYQQQYTVVWDLTNRNGVQVPDGTYYIRLELTNDLAENNHFHRAAFVFLKDGNSRSQFYASEGGFLNVTLDYKFTPTARPEIASKPATFITSNSAWLCGQILDTGGENPNVHIYWGKNDGGAEAGKWGHSANLGRRPAGLLHLDLTGLDASTEYHYRLYAQNSAGGQWADRTADFTTRGATGYYTGYRVQSGRTRVRGTRLDVDILAVNNTGRAFALFSYGTGWWPEEENADAVMARGRLLDADTLRIERTSTANSTWVSWQVIECLGQQFQVYRGSGSFSNEQLVIDAPLNGSQVKAGQRTSGPALPDVKVDPARCIAYVTADTSSDSRTYYHEALLTAYVNSSTTIRIERAAAGHAAVNYNWVVVEFDPAAIASVQHGHLQFAGASPTEPASAQILPVHPSSSLLLYQARSTINGLAYAAVAGRLASSNTVEFYQYTGTSGGRDVEYHVVDFGPSASAQRGRVDDSNDEGWRYADCRLAQPVDTSRAMFFHGQTCNGTADSYPQPFSTAAFTADDNLRIERQFPGQQSHIEWQVLELPATFVAQ